MSALASTNQSVVDESVAQISVNARVDYILRFSKQAVIVLDDAVEHYSAIGSQFLGSIPSHHNAAYLSVSPKLNDIQIRARIIEQLFFDQPFDPEKSIAVTLINLVKANPQTLSIVIEHAQYLSLQLTHELCQLAEIAKKSKLEVNVLILADMRLGSRLYENQTLFSKKVSILSAQTGQLMSVNAKLFKPQVSWLAWTASKLLLSLFAMLILLSIVIILFLANRDVTSFSGLSTPVAAKEDKISIGAERGAMVNSKEINGVTNESNLNEQVTANSRHSGKAGETANQFDILAAISGNSLAVEPQKQLPKKAQVSDIYTALSSRAARLPLSQSNEKLQLSKTMQDVVDTTITNNAKNAQHNEVIDFANNSSLVQTAGEPIVLHSDLQYYAQFDRGFVVQLAGFRESSVMTTFIDQFRSQVSLHYYQRIQSGKPYWVVTSNVFSTKSEALAHIDSLPAQLQIRTPWVKSIAAVNKELIDWENKEISR